MKASIRIAWLLGNFLFLALLLRLEQGGGYPLWDTRWLSYASTHKGVLIFGALYGSYLIWRGISLGREPIGFDRLHRTFTLGLAGLGMLLLLWSFGAAGAAWGPITVSVGILVALFFFAGLAGLALSNYIAMQQEARRIAKRAPSLSQRWTVLALIIALAVSLLGLGLANVAFVNLSALRAPLVWAAQGIGLILVYAIAYPMGYLAEGIIYAIKWLLALVGRKGTPPNFQLPQAVHLTPQPTQGTGNGLLGNGLVVAEWALLIAVIGFVLYLLVRFYLRSRTARQQTDFEETSESLFTKERFLADLLAFFMGLWASLRRRAALPVQVPVAARAGATEDESRTYTLREIYRGLLSEGRRAGSAKKDGETPHEYAMRLGLAIPPAAQDVRTITEEYARERYGAQPAPAAKLPELNLLWRRIRSFFPSNRRDTT